MSNYKRSGDELLSKRVKWVILVTVLFCAVPFSQAQQRGPVLASSELMLPLDAEVGLEITARAPGASWAKTGAESPAITIEVDGVYNQDLLLWAGHGAYIYRLILGRLAVGKHRVTATLNRAQSAPAARNPAIVSMRAVPFTRNTHHTADDLLALANSPILYQRPNTIDRYSDLPLLMYYEISHPAKDETQVRYTAIFSNEDGGTATSALMARWGRAADIEWVYEFRARHGQIIEESYQGVSHEKKPFTGKRINGNHPVLSVVSDNNNFSDEPGSTSRYALMPVAADLRSSTRESVLDANPSMYRIVAEELAREGKLHNNPSDENTISDPRSYVYVDLHALQSGTTISVEVTTTSESSRSDLNQPKLRIDRSGYFRTAIRLTSVPNASAVAFVTITCHSDGMHECEAVEVKSISILDQQYKPQFLQFQRHPARTLKPNERMTIYCSH